jgi:hypothetical protein
MPSVSAAQHRFFAEMMSNPEEAARRGISPKTAAEFVHADKGRVDELPEHKRRRALAQALMFSPEKLRRP